MKRFITLCPGKRRFIQPVRAEPVKAFANLLIHRERVSTRPSVLNEVEGSMRTDLIGVSLVQLHNPRGKDK